MSPEEAGKLIQSSVAVTREDVARAKDWLVQATGTNTSGMAEQWVRDQGFADIRTVETNSPECATVLAGVARGFSLHLSFFQGVWELINSGDLFPAEANGRWQPHLTYKTPHGSGGIPLGIT